MRRNHSLERTATADLPVCAVNPACRPEPASAVTLLHLRPEAFREIHTKAVTGQVAGSQQRSGSQLAALEKEVTLPENCFRLSFSPHPESCFNAVNGECDLAERCFQETFQLRTWNEFRSKGGR